VTELDPASIPAVAWRRGIGVPADNVGRPRVTEPMIDDGAWAGVPIGGIGSGSIGRTYRGDFRRWHLTVGDHRSETVPGDAWSLFVEGGGTRDARVLAALEDDSGRGWGTDMPVGGGTYHALVPRAWFDYAWDGLPIRVVEEQLSPLLPGDYSAAALPVGVSTWSLENATTDEMTVGIMLTWVDRLSFERGVGESDGGRVSSRGEVTGVEFSAGPAVDGMPASFAIAVEAADGVDVSTVAAIDESSLRAVWDDFAASGRIAPVASGARGDTAAVCATVRLAPGERRRIRFSIAWDLPSAIFGGNRFDRRHTAEWGTGGGRALDIAAHGIASSDAWRARIDAWQRPILANGGRPDWYRAALFNELYFLVDGGTVWTADGGDGAGRFAILECYDYPFYNTLDVDFYASWALLQLWPELERSVIRDFVATVDHDDPEPITIQATGLPAVRKVAGALPHDLGGPGETPFERPNHYRFQDVNAWKDLNSKFVLRVWRDIALLRDDALVSESWPAVRTAIDHLATSDRDGDGLPEHGGGPDQTYDTWPMTGPSSYGGSLWLAALEAAARIAERAGDAATAARWRATRDRGRASFESVLWRGDHYAFDGTGNSTVMADQLAGQWYADACGLGDIVDRARVESALRTVHRLNVRSFVGGTMGPVNGMCPEGTIDASSQQSAEVWTGTAYALAAFMIGRGLVREAWETAEGVARVTYECGLWFRTPEAYDEDGNFRASLYLRPLAIWAIEHALTSRPTADRGE
jgi:non-lysosomal glucosylceramidase